MLNARQTRFCMEYVIDFNASRAAMAAGYSKKTAGQIGYENLKKPEIQSFISGLQDQKVNDLFITKNSVLIELARIAFRSRPGAYPNVSDKNALSALSLLGRHVGLFVEQDEQSFFKHIEDQFRQAAAALQESRAERKVNAAE